MSNLVFFMRISDLGEIPTQSGNVRPEWRSDVVNASLKQGLLSSLWRRGYSQ